MSGGTRISSIKRFYNFFFFFFVKNCKISTEHSPSLGFSWDCGVRVEEALRSATAVCAFRAAFFWGTYRNYLINGMWRTRFFLDRRDSFRESVRSGKNKRAVSKVMLHHETTFLNKRQALVKLLIQ